MPFYEGKQQKERDIVFLSPLKKKQDFHQEYLSDFPNKARYEIFKRLAWISDDYFESFLLPFRR